MIEEFPWSSKEDTGVDEGKEGHDTNPKTVFRFGAIDATIRTMILDNTLVYSQSDDGRPANTLRTGLRNVELVRYMLKGVEHYSGPDGAAIPLAFEERFTNNKVYKVATEHFISTLPPWLVNEMGEMLMAKITKNTELVGKLPTP